MQKRRALTTVVMIVSLFLQDFVPGLVVIEVVRAFGGVSIRRGRLRDFAVVFSRGFACCEKRGFIEGWVVRMSQAMRCINRRGQSSDLGETAKAKPNLARNASSPRLTSVGFQSRVSCYWFAYSREEYFPVHFPRITLSAASIASPAQRVRSTFVSRFSDQDQVSRAPTTVARPAPENLSIAVHVTPCQPITWSVWRRGGTFVYFWLRIFRHRAASVHFQASCELAEAGVVRRASERSSMYVCMCAAVLCLSGGKLLCDVVQWQLPSIKLYPAAVRD